MKYPIKTLLLGCNVRYRHKSVTAWSEAIVVSVNIHGQCVLETRDEHFIADSEDWIIEAMDSDKGKAVDFFYNESGDYTLTLFEEPIGIIKKEDDAEQIKRYFSALSMRIDTLQKMLKINL